jgi:hypothetical protein
MDSKTRAAVVVGLRAGRSNAAIARQCGVTSNAVAGIRDRDGFGGRMTQAEARALPKDAIRQRKTKAANETAIIEVLTRIDALPLRQIYPPLVRVMKKRTAQATLRRLKQRGVVIAISWGRGALWRLADRSDA